MAMRHEEMLISDVIGTELKKCIVSQLSMYCIYTT